MLRGEATVVQGTLQGVQWESRGRTGSAYGLELHVDGQEYAIIRYSATSSVGRLNSGIEGDGTVEDVRFLMRRLREKIEEDPSHPLWLLTVRGLGYKLAK